MTDRPTSATAPPPPKRKRNRVQRRERRAIERAERGEMFNHTWWAAQSSGAPPSPIVPDQLTTIGGGGLNIPLLPRGHSRRDRVQPEWLRKREKENERSKSRKNGENPSAILLTIFLVFSYKNMTTR